MWSIDKKLPTVDKKTLRIDTGDLGVNGGACFMLSMRNNSLKYSIIVGMIKLQIINTF